MNTPSLPVFGHLAQYVNQAKRPVTDITKAKTLLVFDVANICARAQHIFGTVSGLRASSGEKSGHIFGALRMVVNAYNHFVGQGNAAIVFAIEGFPVERYRIDPSYKANRRSQIDLDAVGVSNTEDAEDAAADNTADSYTRGEQISALLTLPGVAMMAPASEADDVIATLAALVTPYQRMYIFSTDRDLWQLMRPNVSLIANDYKPVTTEACRERFGVPPGQLLMYKAIFGDPSDCIPKALTRGRKTAPVLEFLAGHRNVTNIPTLIAASVQSKFPFTEDEFLQITQNWLIVSPAVVHADEMITEITGNQRALSSIVTRFEMSSLQQVVTDWF